jgi:hypothetical protein
MRLWNTVELTHLALGLVPEILDTIDVVPVVREELAMIDPEVVKVGYIQHIVSSVPIVEWEMA